MEFRIADTFTDSLTRLTGDEQKAVKTTAFDLQLNSANPGMSFHKIEKAKDKNFWSVRVSSDIRLIVHKSDTVSVFNGPPPTIRSLQSESQENKAVGNWMEERSKEGVLPHEFGVFVRSEAQLDRAQAAVNQAGMSFIIPNERVETTHGNVSISTMRLAKGLEFRAVVVMACDDEIIPLQERIETVGDDSDLQEVYDTERHLLYVACTRARDHLLVTSVEPASEFLDDMQAQSTRP
jgi:superfamily I DNA/RNA helicase